MHGDDDDSRRRRFQKERSIINIAVRCSSGLARPKAFAARSMNEKKKARPRIENGSNEKGNWEASSTDCALTLEDGRAGQLLSYGVPLSNFGILQTKTVLHYSSFVATDVLDRFNEPFAVAASFGAGQVRRVVSLQLVEHTRTALHQ
jgi:hypothetical protein